MEQWISKHGTDDRTAMLDYAYALSTHYGEAIGSLACRMYEETAAAQKVIIKTAEAATTPEYGEVARAVNGTLKRSEKMVPSTIGRLVKQVGADTTLKNAMRDGAEWAWVPMGDTCAFCIMLASRGWQRQRSSSHAEHIHANCDCQYAVRFDGKSTVQGYDPNEYLEMYESAEGRTTREKVNSMRRKLASKKNNENKGYEDITKHLIESAKPGTGEMKFEPGTDEADRKIVEWIHETYGGDITCLAERPQVGKMPDAIWDGKYYEFKAPTSKTAIDDRIRKAQKQLYEVIEREGKSSEGRGMVIDISNNKLSEDEAIKQIIHSARVRCKGPTDVIVKKGNELIIAVRIK